jgi:hypothetical protein
MEDTHGQLLADSVFMAICGIGALLAFFFWLARGSKNKPSLGIGIKKRLDASPNESQKNARSIFSKIYR